MVCELAAGTHDMAPSAGLHLASIMISSSSHLCRLKRPEESPGPSGKTDGDCLLHQLLQLLCPLQAERSAKQVSQVAVCLLSAQRLGSGHRRTGTAADRTGDVATVHRLPRHCVRLLC